MGILCNVHSLEYIDIVSLIAHVLVVWQDDNAASIDAINKQSKAKQEGKGRKETTARSIEY